MGLRLSETLALQVSDIDAARKQVHIRRGKGHKDRFVPLPDLTYHALRALWRKHRNPCWLFPNAIGSMERVRQATTHRDRGGAQAAMKAVVAQCGIKKKSRFIPYGTASPLTCLSRASVFVIFKDYSVTPVRQPPSGMLNSPRPQSAMRCRPSMLY